MVPDDAASGRSNSPAEGWTGWTARTDRFILWCLWGWRRASPRYLGDTRRPPDGRGCGSNVPRPRRYVPRAPRGIPEVRSVCAPSRNLARGRPSPFFMVLPAALDQPSLCCWGLPPGLPFLLGRPPGSPSCGGASRQPLCFSEPPGPMCLLYQREGMHTIPPNYRSSPSVA